ncbi:hypothetical protein K450DRAFT_256823 [Umbelopsis ramanniana AG]|uniref:NAD-dependent epimerase/dehydratase domain-containing protein n=1 Tax=Umbelopsis ramanniana AG TaxID=1314678 RepID=A0AAD5HA11_UMBRA|nr:uncharacterized protein K450DRAFT_256823 [Umbelopsis ramanniana AG]KAI8576452.1 hypothetical protein K450DRAFT_256823 [Umbelopsis ramanniana AG]
MSAKRLASLLSSYAVRHIWTEIEKQPIADKIEVPIRYIRSQFHLSYTDLSYIIMTGELVLVTGANGFVGSHVCRELLNKGYRIRVAVRSESKANDVKKVNPQHKDRIESVIVPDITSSGAFDQAVQGCDYVMHIASPFTFDIKDNEKDLLLPAREGTKNILQAASTHKSIKRVIITSSFAAVVDVSKGLRPGYTYTEKDWNPATWEEARKSDNPGFVYCASKKFAEEEGWDFVKNRKPSFDITTICMPMVYGPVAHHIDSLDHLNESSMQIWQIVNGKSNKIPETVFPGFVDVRDVAVAHVAALTTASASNSRYLVSSGIYRFEQVTAIVNKKYPDRKLPEGDTSRLDCYDIDGSKAERELLQRPYINFEKCISDEVEQLYELEKKTSK